MIICIYRPFWRNKLIQGDYDILDSEYGIPHICYVMRQSLKTNNIRSDKFAGEKLLKEYLKREPIDMAWDLDNLLWEFERCLKQPNMELEEKIFTCIAVETKFTLSSGSTSFDKRYNELVLNKIHENEVTDKETKKNSGEAVTATGGYESIHAKHFRLSGEGAV